MDYYIISSKTPATKAKTIEMPWKSAYAAMQLQPCHVVELFVKCVDRFYKSCKPISDIYVTGKRVGAESSEERGVGKELFKKKNL